MTSGLATSFNRASASVEPNRPDSVAVPPLDRCVAETPEPGADRRIVGQTSLTARRSEPAGDPAAGWKACPTSADGAAIRPTEAAAHKNKIDCALRCVPQDLRRTVAFAVLIAVLGQLFATPVAAQDVPPDAPGGPREPAAAAPAEDGGEAELDPAELFRAGGTIGIVILVLSLAMVALVVEHLISIRRGALIPEETAAEVHELIQQRQFAAAEELCREHPSFLSYVLAAGLREAGAGYASVEKAMEDASAAQAARLFRKIEYLSVIGTLAPMLGLLGTVWGMIIAFHEFQTTANPQVSELAPGIYRALVTTLLGLGVAVPALAAFAWFRNRIDELVADGTAVAEHVFFDYKVSLQEARRAKKGDAVRTPVSLSRPGSQEKTG